MAETAAGPTTRTTCPYCGVGCGVLATPQADGSVAIAGDPDHPANFGKLCSKGTALGATLGMEGRLTHPSIHGQRASWNGALDLVARRFSETVAEHGPDSVALYVSGQLLTEDYYVANKLMKGFIGTANIDTNSRLCMASSVAAHRRAFGSDTVPALYDDLDEADLVVLVGSNFAWCHPVLFQRLLATRERRGTRIIVIDPRRTMTAEAADLHLPLEPDSDAALFLGLLRHLEADGLADTAYLDAHVSGTEAALVEARSLPVARVASLTGLPPEQIRAFYEAFARTPRTLTIFSQGVNQSVRGTDKANAIINCHLYTGRIGKPGASPFSITGQPNAMGGREVGGLANMLAAHMNIEDEAARERVQRFWQSPTMAAKPGLKAVDLFDAVLDGRIKALWIMATNPADSLPEAGRIDAALMACPFVVVSDILTETDTTRHAHVLLPALGWGEKDGTVTNSERRISRQRGFLPPPGEARADWWALAEVAKRMGFSGFEYPNAAAIFREHAALSAFENGGTRDFDLGGVATIRDDAFNEMAPFLWPKPADGPEGGRFFASGGFFTPDRRARMVAVALPPETKPRDAENNLWLNTGRIRDQWHTMTRTGRAPALLGQFGEPFAEIHPDDAAAAGIAPADLVRVRSRHGEAVVRAMVTPRQRRGSVFVPIHWTDRFASNGRIDKLVDRMTDPVSGQPGLKRTPARIERYQAQWFGFAVTARRPEPPPGAYWAIAPVEGGYRIEMAGETPLADPQFMAARLFGLAEDEAEWVALHDREAGRARLAAFRGEALVGALFLAPEPVRLSRSFLAEAIGAAHSAAERFRILAGRGGADQPDRGAIVCACFQVGVNEILTAIREGKASVEVIGDALKAGTNCGSCRHDIRRMLDENRLEKAG
ncbi:MAG: molybdopterin-dependent oxidoreductase [Beijerinckiaceae bacterium]|nr:molybdopterin-dependent oxidoreductase [Beijerinckiaceae bacterium]MCZ8299410.1 molybdopterin-dependent oxidoreductase [Beijerinckiaceae bacterium]